MHGEGSDTESDPRWGWLGLVCETIATYSEGVILPSNSSKVKISYRLHEREQFCPPTSMQLLSTNKTSDDNSPAMSVADQ